jgi:hypothetical protein
MRRAAISIADALLDAHLLGAALGDAGSWRTWLVVLKAESSFEKALRHIALLCGFDTRA